MGSWHRWMAEQEKLEKNYDWRLVWRILACLLPYRVQVLWALVCLGFYSIFQALPPLLTKTAIDIYLVPTGEVPGWIQPFVLEDPNRGLLQIILLYLLALFLTFLLEFGQSYIMQWTGQHAMFDIRKRVMNKLQDLDISYYDQNPVGRLVTRVTTDIDVLNELFASGVVKVLGEVLTLAIIAGVMVSLSWQLTLILVAATPVVILITIVYRRMVSVGYRLTRIAVARINSYLQEHVSGMSIVQLFRQESRSLDEFNESNRDYCEANKRTTLAYAWFYPVIEFIGIIAIATIVVYSGFLIEEGTVSLGILVAFFQYGVRFFRPIQELSEKYNLLQSALAAGERVFQLLDEDIELKRPQKPKSFPADSRTIEFDHVWFAYKGEDWVLKDFSVVIEPGETVAIVGHTGAGKTTMISLLLRFYDVQKGAIRIGGVDIREMDQQDLRQHFGVVLQDPFLFTGTVGGNIRLGTEHIESEDLVAAAEQVHLLEFIASLPQGFDQEVRERGDGLSTGQKQLISFARALAHDPRFLILDEATSSVDAETESRVKSAMSRLIEGRTSLIIAHRLSTIQRADRILVLHHGELREVGSHAELLSERGIYFKLYQLQYRDQEALNRSSASNSAGNQPARDTGIAINPRK
jgi:ATP-binding cassette subfamily B protein